MEAVLLGQIDLLITFGTEGNFRKETLTFKVVGFLGTYHTILSRPAYFKLKMPEPKGVITIDTKFQHSYE
jgi:hypothetical protein